LSTVAGFAKIFAALLMRQTQDCEIIDFKGGEVSPKYRAPLTGLTGKVIPKGFSLSFL